MTSTILLGDSHSQVHFTHLMNMFPEIDVIERHSNPGWSALKYLNSGILDELPQANTIIVALGGNNQKLDSSFDETIDIFLDKLYQKRIKNIIWIGPFWSDPNIRADVLKRHEWTNARLKEILPSTIKYIDVFPISEGLSTTDGVHFSSSKYKYIVEEILPIIKSQVGTIKSYVRIYKWWLLSSTILGLGTYLYWRKYGTKNLTKIS